MLVELLRGGAENVPETAVVDSEAVTTTYAECAAESDALAAGLVERGVTRFAVVNAAVHRALPLLCASSAVGREACVYPRDLDVDGIGALAEAFDHDVVVSDVALELPGRQVVTLDELRTTPTGAVPADPSTPAPVMILTTGTTGRPKGARHDWRRLIAAMRDPAPDPSARWLFAYNLNQFAGVQVLLYALATRGTLVVPSDNRPHEAVTTMREREVTHVSATPTFWRMVVNQLDEDTARQIPLRQITLGGEAIPPALPDELRRLFPHARLSQIYASTEFGSTGAVRDGRNGLPLTVLDRGEDAPVQFRVVDGELHTRSRVGMLGYYGEPDTGDDWRPTGDLVEVRDNRIYFVGRTSEVINVGGVKVHPLPVEEHVCGVDGVELAHAYARDNAVTGQIVAVDVVARPGVDTDELKDRIREACGSLPSAAQPRRIRFVDDVTRQQKIDRRAQDQA